MLIYRNVASVMSASLLLQISVGVLGVALPLAMALAGWSGLMIGLVVAGYGAGFMAGAWFSPKVIGAIGHIRAYAAFAGGAAALTLMLALDSSPGWWLAARFGFGLCAAGIFAVAESWIADATPSERRGAVISMYQIVGRAGLILGPFLLAFPGVALTESFVIAGIFLALALIPVTATRRAQPALPEGESVSPLRLFSIAPAAAGAAFAAGAINSGLLAFIPIWAQTLDPARISGAAATALASIYFFSMLIQWPLGKLSDRVDRRLVIAGLALAAAVFAGVLAFIVSPGLTLGALLVGLWGAASLCYYGVAVAHAADRSTIEELPAIASGILLVWAAGSVIGPILAGLAYASAWEARGLFLYAAIASLILSVLVLWRSRARAAVTAEEREPFVNLQATSGALAEIDRPDEDYDAEPVRTRMD
jgi:MFS family permease